MIKQKVVFINCSPFTDCISEINNKVIDVATPVFNLIDNSDNYLKTSVSLWHTIEMNHL